MRKQNGTIDATDRTILRALQENARVTNRAIARRVALAPSAVLERIRRLERRGLIRGYEARLDADGLGLGLLAFVFVRSRAPLRSKRTERLLARIPQVQEIHHIAGEDCFLVKVRAADTAELNRLLREHIGAIRGVTATRTTIVLETEKETGRLPLPAEK
jgi:Lrp/AsnC family leucine-responsive transcriptional regulator